MTEQKPKKEHRIFHYDPDSGRSTPVKAVRYPDGSTALVPVVIDEDDAEVVDPEND